MKCIPIRFNGEGVDSIRSLRKTQTRRPLYKDSLQVIPREEVRGDGPFRTTVVAAGQATEGRLNRYGAVSALATNDTFLGVKPGEFDFVCPYAGGTTGRSGDRWCVVPNLDQCLEVVDNPSLWQLSPLRVWIEHIQDISEVDMLAEGIWFDGSYYRSVVHPVKGTLKCWPSVERAMMELWDSIYGSSGFRYEENPWVWVVEFGALVVGTEEEG